MGKIIKFKNKQEQEMVDDYLLKSEITILLLTELLENNELTHENLKEYNIDEIELIKTLLCYISLN